MNREVHVRFCESAGVRFPRATHLHDPLATERTFRAMDIVDDFTREGLALDVRFSFASVDVIAALDELALVRGYPTMIRFDNGSEFTSRAMLRWAAEHGVILQYSDPGKPTQNAHVESFNGRVRDEFLNQHNFVTLHEACLAAAAWLEDYNAVRPHSSLGYLTPREFAALQPNQSRLTVPSGLRTALRSDGRR